MQSLSWVQRLSNKVESNFYYDATENQRGKGGLRIQISRLVIFLLGAIFWRLTCTRSPSPELSRNARLSIYTYRQARLIFLHNSFTSYYKLRFMMMDIYVWYIQRYKLCEHIKGKDRTSWADKTAFSSFFMASPSLILTATHWTSVCSTTFIRRYRNASLSYEVSIGNWWICSQVLIIVPWWFLKLFTWTSIWATEANVVQQLTAHLRQATCWGRWLAL